MNSAEQVKSISESDRYIEVQGIQTAYRERLLHSWQIQTGARILEIGCGQGDMTAVLAQSVGPNGRVVAVDTAGPDYGAPLNLQQATDLVKASAAGLQTEFHFGFDVLNPEVTFADGQFDAVVLAHCSWYFQSIDSLEATLRRIRPWTNRLCFAEWDIEPKSFAQVSHMLAVLIQGQIEAFKRESQANVRTPISRQKLKDLLQRTGWRVESEISVDTMDLQDADWEIQACLRSSVMEAMSLDLPQEFTILLESQVDVLRALALPSRNSPLSSYTIVAESPLNFDPGSGV